MSDTFHKDISDKDLVFLFDTMVKRKDLTFQVLTKRADRMLEFFKEALTYYNKCQIKDVPFFFKQWGNTNSYREPMKHYIERCKEFPKRGNGLIMVEKRAETFYTRKTKDNQNAE